MQFFPWKVKTCCESVCFANCKQLLPWQPQSTQNSLHLDLPWNVFSANGPMKKWDQDSIASEDMFPQKRVVKNASKENLLLESRSGFLCFKMFRASFPSASLSAVRHTALLTTHMTQFFTPSNCHGEDGLNE